MNPRFLNRFVNQNGSTNYPEVLDINDELTNIPWLSIPDTIIVPDDWDIFWHLWNSKKMSAENLGNIWDLFYIYLHPALSNDEIMFGHPGPVLPGQYQDWTMFFPKMFEKIFNLMPFKRINKISLASNTKTVPIHIDSTPKYYPWPNSLRIMLWDTNTKPTFFLTSWPECSYKNPPLKDFTPAAGMTYFNEPVEQKSKIYVDLPANSNTFIYSNGAYLHGADLAKPKILMLIWGDLDPEPWKKKLKNIMAMK